MALAENFKRCTIEMLLLILLTENDKYGYQLALELDVRSNGVYQMKESALYPPLYRMADKGYITTRNALVNGRNRVYYHLEPQGKQYLQELQSMYDTWLAATSQIVQTTLQEAPDENT